MTLASFMRALMVLMAVTLAGPALAQQPPPGGRPPPTQTAAQKVTIELVVVHATNANTTVDPKISPDIIKHLKFLNYTSFSHLADYNASLALKQETTFSIVGGRRVKVQLLNRSSTEAKIRVRMYNGQGKLLDTTVSIHRNRSFIVAGPKHAGGVLILPVTATY